jgi:L-asparaginase/beta-aspartyl-peptidase (threonine type)
MRDMANIFIAVHGGAGGNSADSDGCRAAAEAALSSAKNDGDSLEAAIAAVVVLEDDGRFNAGSGSVLCLDGLTVEMDAAVMDTRGRLGAVTCIRNVKNPVRVAREVANTPHCLLAGEGAIRFAEAAGCEMREARTSVAVLKKHAAMLKELQSEGCREQSASMRRYWNYKMDWAMAVERYGCGTVGAVVCDGAGNFAAATSTGGCAPSLLGRVGDTPLIGSGFYAGEHGAVAATGIGEAIMRQLLARTVYGWLQDGTSLDSALARGIELFPHNIDVGLIAVTRAGGAAMSNRDMPSYVFNG